MDWVWHGIAGMVVLTVFHRARHILAWRFPRRLGWLITNRERQLDLITHVIRIERIERIEPDNHETKP